VKVSGNKWVWQSCVLTAPDGGQRGSAADFPESLIRGRLSMRLLASVFPDLMLLCHWKGTQNLRENDWDNGVCSGGGRSCDLQRVSAVTCVEPAECRC
jgi:hypothetical protein